MDWLAPCCFATFFVFVVIPALFVLAIRWDRRLLVQGDAKASATAPAGWRRIALEARIKEYEFGRNLSELLLASSAGSLWTVERDGISAWVFAYITSGWGTRQSITSMNCAVLRLPDSWILGTNLDQPGLLDYESKDQNTLSRRINAAVQANRQFRLEETNGVWLLLTHRGGRGVGKLATVMKDADELIRAVRAAR